MYIGVFCIIQYNVFENEHLKGGINMPIASKENGKSGILHWASKALNAEGNFEKT